MTEVAVRLKTLLPGDRFRYAANKPQPAVHKVMSQWPRENKTLVQSFEIDGAGAWCFGDVPVHLVGRS